MTDSLGWPTHKIFQYGKEYGNCIPVTPPVTQTQWQFHMKLSTVQPLDTCYPSARGVQQGVSLKKGKLPRLHQIMDYPQDSTQWVYQTCGAPVWSFRGNDGSPVYKSLVVCGICCYNSLIAVSKYNHMFFQNPSHSSQWIDMKLITVILLNMTTWSVDSGSKTPKGSSWNQQ